MRLIKFRQIKKEQSGFTILELVIATLVFSVVLLMMTYGIIQISRTYIKGYVVSETQNTARSIIDNITQAIQTSSPTSPNGIYIPQNGDPYFCINGYLYQYTIHTKLTPTNNVFYIDKPVSGCGAGINPANYPCTPTYQCKELLGQGMQVSVFNIGEVDTSSRLYRINLGVLYGTVGQSIDPTGTGNNCYSLNAGGEFCSYIFTRTTVQQRLQ